MMFVDGEDGMFLYTRFLRGKTTAERIWGKDVSRSLHNELSFFVGWQGVAVDKIGKVCSLLTC